MRRTILFAAIFSAGFLARGLWTGSAVQADGNGLGAAEPINGDVNGDGRLDVSDGIYIINYVFRGGPLPVPITCLPRELPATGQTKCYDKAEHEIPCNSADFPGQDGLYQAGCPRQGRYTDNGDGTVTDTCTGLMWQKDTADVNGNGTLDDQDRINWQNALKYCESLTFAGHDDWRLPNVRELQSIVDYGRFEPASDPIFGAVSDFYWSSSPYVDSPDNAWGVYFGDGYVSTGRDGVYRVCAVRNAD